MKTWNALTEHIKGLHQRSRQGNTSLARKLAFLESERLKLKELGKEASSSQISRPHTSKIPAPAIAAFAILSLTSAIGYRFYNQPQLKEGTFAPKTLIASRDALVEDIPTTEAKRKEAQTGIIPVLKIDSAIDERIYKRFDEQTGEIDRLREVAGSIPFASESLLSLPNQQSLRRLDEKEWQSVLAAIRRPAAVPPAANGTIVPTSTDGSAIAQLQNYARQAGPIQLEDAISRIEKARSQYQIALSALEREAEDGFAIGERQALLDLEDSVWQASKEAMRLSLQRILVQGIPEGLPEQIQEQTALVQLSGEIPDPALEIGVRSLLAVLEPNLMQDLEATKLLAEQAARKVKPAIYEVQKGEIIAREGEVIGRREFVLLDKLKMSRRGVNWRGLMLSAVLASGSFGLLIFVRQRLNLRLRSRDRILICLLSISTPLLVQLNFKYLNLAGVGLLASGFYHPTLAIAQVLVVSGLTVFSAIVPEGVTSIPWEYIIPSATGGLIAALVAGRLRSREDLALLGGAIGLTQGGVYLLATLIVSATPGTIWTVVLPGALICGLSGVAWWIVALGLSPYLERAFDLVTPIRLAELSNPNRALLERLATETPGTFQHTLFVASLAEAAARELRANVELVRAGTLYHDIGKMHDPLGFIENQMGGPNKHDKINDPWKSAEIIKKHVSEGLAIARRYNLPQAIRDFIPEHQGTILISYFYLQAQQRAQQEGTTVSEADFRYDGPVPQSRETGIVMLADACEAALRSLQEATPELALTTIEKIFTARWRDRQLAESGLKLEELRTIANVFVRVWQQYNHQRIAYPKAALEVKPASRSTTRS